ncbi:MAG: hypothetical protein ACRC6T_06735 [Sarcina sp.]
MKKLLIVGLLVVVVGFVGGISYKYESNHKSNIQLQNQTENNINTNTNNSSDNTTNDNVNNITNKNITNTQNSGNNNIQSTNNMYSNELSASNNINIPVTSSLYTESNNYKTQIQNLIVKSEKISSSSISSDAAVSQGCIKIGNLWKTLNNNMIENITNNVDLTQQTIFTQEVALTKQLNNSETNEEEIAQRQEGGGSIGSVEQAGQYATMNEQEAIYLFGGYIDNNDINPISNIQEIEMSIYNSAPNMQNEMPAGYYSTIQSGLSIIENTQNESTTIINNAKQNKTSIIDAYTHINNLWINAVDNIYNKVQNDPQQKYASGTTPREYDTIWLNYKNQMMNLSQNMYTNPTEKELAKNRMSIKLTQLECYILLYQFA